MREEGIGVAGYESMSQHLADLRAAVREGDDRATAALVLALQPTVWTYCSLVGPPGQAITLVEATFLEAFSSLRGSDPVEPDVTVWILRSARATCATAVRKHEREQRRAARSPWRSGSATAPVSTDPLHELPIERREVWALVTGLGFDATFTSHVIEASLATVKVRLGNAQRDLDRRPESATG